MAKFCTNCGKELDENAALCLNCGVLVEKNTTKDKKEKKKGLPTWTIVLIIVGSILLIPLIFIILIGVFTYKIVDNTMNNIDEYIEETVIQNGSVGDTLTTDEFKIKLHDTKTYQSIGSGENLYIPIEGKEYLVFLLEVENISNNNEYISKYDFNGYADGYEVELTYLYNDLEELKIEGLSELNANLPPNKKTRGYLAFEVDTSWQEFEIHYEDWFESNELIFTVVNEDSSNITGA